MEATTSRLGTGIDKKYRLSYNMEMKIPLETFKSKGISYVQRFQYKELS